MRTFLSLLFLALASCEILEEDISDKRVHLLAPADQTVVTAGAVDFHWRTLQYATGYEFILAAPSFGSAARIVADTVIYADSLGRGYLFRVELAAGDYEWAVTAFNGGYTSDGLARRLRVETAPAPENPDEPEVPETTNRSRIIE